MQSRWRPDNEPVTPRSPACPELGRIRAMLSPLFPQPMGVRMAYQTRFRGSICPLVLETRRTMRRRKTARNASSPRVSPLLRCSRFASCYGTNHPSATHRKTTSILSPTSFERIPLGGSRVTGSSSWTCRPCRAIGRRCSIHVRSDEIESLEGRDLKNFRYRTRHVGRKEVTSRRSPSVSQYGSAVIHFNR